jgi:cell division protein FtsQ
MKASTTRKSPRRKASSVARTNSRQKVRRLSMFDRFLRTLPFAEHEIQRAFTWVAVAVLAIILISVARYLGAGAVLHDQYAQLAARAGFVVKRIETSGMERVDQLKVYDIILAEKNRSMPLVDIEKIRTELLKYGWIKDVRISRRLPETLVVDIIERKPTAVWQNGDKLSLIDEKGVPLENVRPDSVDGLPMLTGEGGNVQAVALEQLLDKAPSLKSQVGAASWIGNRRWDLKFKTGETLALPEGEELAAEALINFARMDGINRLLGKNIIHFDMRDPNKAYIRKAPKQVAKEPSVSDKSGDKKEGKSNTDKPTADKLKQKDAA